MMPNGVTCTMIVHLEDMHSEEEHNFEPCDFFN